MTSHLELRSSVFFAILACLTVALAPWLTGGREPVAMLISSAALLLGLVLALLQPEIPRMPASWITRVYLLFVGWGTLSLVWTVNRYSTALWMVTWLSAPAVFYLAYVLKQCRNGERWLLRAYLASAAIFGGYGLYQYFARPYPGLANTFYGSDAAAAYLLPAVVLCAFWASKTVGERWRVWITIVFSIAAIITSSVLITRLEPSYGVAPVGQGSGARYAALGYGAGTFGDAHSKYQSGVSDASGDAYNVYVQVLAELGSVGFAIFLLFFIPLIFVVYQSTFSAGRPYVFWSLVGLMVVFGVSNAAAYPSLIWLGAVFAALGYSPQFESTSKRRYGLLLLVFTQIGLSVAAYYIFVGNVFADRGAAAQDDGDYAAAADYFERATSGPVFSPDWVDSQGIDMLTLSSGKKSDQADQALALARKAESLDPFNPTHYQLEAHVLVAEGNIKEAESLLRKAVSMDPNNRPDLYSDLAGLLWSTGRGDEAINLAEPFLQKYDLKIIAGRSADPKIKPALANLYGMVGQIYLESHNIANARKCAQQAIKLYPQSLRGRALTNRLNKQ